jgi:RHS repeat-associated protein
VRYARFGGSRVARLVATDLAAKMFPDGVADGKITAGDAYLAGASAPTGRMLLSGARRILYEALPAATWLGHDHLGSITVETDDQGAVIGRRSFTPFGAVRAQSGDADRYGFTGQETDDSGLLLFQFRELDATVGRWTAEDPAFAASSDGNIGRLGESTTAYAYVANDFANSVDPTGLDRARAIRNWNRLTRSVRAVNRITRRLGGRPGMVEALQRRTGQALTTTGQALSNNPTATIAATMGAVGAAAASQIGDGVGENLAAQVVGAGAGAAASVAVIAVDDHLGGPVRGAIRRTGSVLERAGSYLTERANDRADARRASVYAAVRAAQENAAQQAQQAPAEVEMQVIVHAVPAPADQPEQKEQ